MGQFPFSDMTGAVGGVADLSIKLDGLADAIKALEGHLSTDSLTGLMREIGVNVRERTADHIGQASVTRHKTADRLGAEHSKFLEFAVGRGQMRAGSSYSPKKGEGEHYTEVQGVSNDSVDIVIGNTPGLRRAFGPMTILPRRAKMLTIPINSISYAHTVAEVEHEGFSIFKPKGKRILATKSESGGIIPLFALCGKTVVPQDRGLLPSEKDLEEWSLDTSEAYLETQMVTAGG